MNQKKQKLELTWIGKDLRPRLEPRILLEDPARSYHAKQRVTENDLFDNRLALKALEAEFTGKVKCVFIDPPYNTGSAFSHYDDGLGHDDYSLNVANLPMAQKPVVEAAAQDELFGGDGA